MTSQPTHQIGLDELRTLGSAEIDQALKDGRLDQLLSGQDPGPPPDPTADEDDEDEDTQLTRVDLERMTGAEVLDALDQGRCDQLLGRR